jgi:hypothetical protein
LNHNPITNEVNIEVCLLGSGIYWLVVILPKPELNVRFTGTASVHPGEEGIRNENNIVEIDETSNSNIPSGSLPMTLFVNKNISIFMNDIQLNSDNIRVVELHIPSRLGIHPDVQNNKVSVNLSWN